MLPTMWASRSYCLTFSGAFMTLVYSPDAFSEIGVVRRHFVRHGAGQQVEVLRAGIGREGCLGRGVVGEPGVGANVTRLVHAFQPEAALISLPREERLAGEERRRVAGGRDELDLRHQDAPR